jgi:hypothetical protein
MVIFAFNGGGVDGGFLRLPQFIMGIHWGGEDALGANTAQKRADFLGGKWRKEVEDRKMKGGGEDEGRRRSQHGSPILPTHTYFDERG